MSDLFLFGPLADRGLLAAVLGPDGAPVIERARPARIAGRRLKWRPGERAAFMRESATGLVEGLLVGVDDLDLRRRLNHFLSGAAKWGAVRVLAPDGAELAAEAPLATASPAGGEDFDKAWSAAPWATVMAGAAGEYMATFGRWPAPQAAALWHPMLIRAGARLRAASEPAPATRRMDRGRGAVRVHVRRMPYQGYFTIEEHDLRFPRFDGTLSETVRRATFVDGDAVIVLPYDPGRDRVLLVEQFRMGPFVRGAPNPWLLEPVAGRIDGAEPPEEAARRELAEETGILEAELIEIARGYPSSGAVSAFFHSYVALCDLPDAAARIGGLASEAEDIRGHVVPFDEAMALLASGEAGVMPLATALFWLEHRRADLAGGRA